MDSKCFYTNHLIGWGTSSGLPGGDRGVSEEQLITTVEGCAGCLKGFQASSTERAYDEYEII